MRGGKNNSGEGGWRGWGGKGRLWGKRYEGGGRLVIRMVFLEREGGWGLVDRRDLYQFMMVVLSIEIRRGTSQSF